MLLRMMSTLIILALAGCTNQVQHVLTDQEKYDRAKQCMDAGMWPDVYSTVVTCNAVGKTPQVELVIEKYRPTGSN